MKRGEVWTVSGGQDYAGKPRPVVVIQDDGFDATDSITICPLTTAVLDLRLARPTVSPTDLNGLRRASKLMVDKITTVPKTKLGRCIGRLDDDAVGHLNRALIVFLGLAKMGRASRASEDSP